MDETFEEKMEAMKDIRPEETVKKKMKPYIILSLICILVLSFPTVTGHGDGGGGMMDDWGHMMPGYDSGMGFIWFLLMTIFWLAVIFAICYVIYLLLKNANIIGGGSESALDILKKRYAKGEITKEQFEEMKKNIL